jgi:hypothetical protein
MMAKIEEVHSICGKCYEEEFEVVDKLRPAEYDKKKGKT